MGELLLCTEPIAAMPFYIDGVSVNIYSLEELCYYILNNTYLIEQDFMREELCEWLEKELGRQSLAAQLRRMIGEKSRLSECIGAILLDCGYCSNEEMLQILSIVREMEEKSEFECKKIRADRLMECRKYLGAIYEYKRLLEAKGVENEDPVVRGNIWHNLGTAYARMFLFAEAANCFEAAFRLNKNEESRREHLFCFRCMRDEDGFIRAAIAYGMDKEEMQELRDELSDASRGIDIVEMEQKLDEIAAIDGANESSKRCRACNEMILEWKNDYRRICGI